MGEITDMMLDGTLCEQCGVLVDDHESPGYPRTCDDCESPEQSTKGQRTEVAASQFKEATILAAKHGFLLRQRTKVHYQLSPRDKTWLLNVYPSNRRLYHDPHKRGPYLRVPDDWTLLDVVQAAIGAELEADTAKAIRRGYQP